MGINLSGKGGFFMKKILMLALVATMLFALSACGSSTTPEETTETTASLPVATQTTAAEQTEVTEKTEDEGSDDEAFMNVFKRDKKIDNYYYEYVMSSNGQRMAGFKLWVNGNRIRFDAEQEGQSIYLDYDKGEGYLYMPDGNILMKMPLESLGSEWESPFLFAGEIDQTTLDSMKYEGRETIDGKVCYVYSGESMGTKVTYYIWKDEGVIVKFSYESGGQPTYEYYFKDLTFGETYDKELELPKDAEIVDMTKQP